MDCWLLLPYAGQPGPQKATETLATEEPPQRREGALIRVMRPVNAAFMYEGERANPSVHSKLTSHLKGHLIPINGLLSRRMREDRAGGKAKKTERNLYAMLTYLSNAF